MEEDKNLKERKKLPGTASLILQIYRNGSGGISYQGTTDPMIGPLPGVTTQVGYSANGKL